MNQNTMPLAQKLIEYRNKKHISMHIPGHKEAYGDAMPELTALMGRQALGCDITEIEGFDDYHDPEGIISDAQRLAAELFGAEETYFLPNGTTSGIMAAVAAAACEGEHIIVASDCHKSVTRGLILSAAEPVYINPFIDKKTGLPAGLDPERLAGVLKAVGAKAVVLTNPSYYGTYSDLRKITEAAHRYGAVVIADEAHGAHLKFTASKDIPDAMSAGADIAVQSTHKMLGSLTQSSMLHVQGDIIDRRRLLYNIRLLTSTSPSYLLMASLDAVRHRMAMNGYELWQRIAHITDMYAEMIDSISGIRCIRCFTAADGKSRPLDRARLLITAEELGMSGTKLAGLLCRDYNIDMELSDESYVLAVMGSGTSEEHMRTLYESLKKISEKASELNADPSYESSSINHDYIKSYAAAAAELKHICTMTPRRAVFSRHDIIEAPYAHGRVCAEEIAVYPPGIPLAVPGEKITDKTIEMIINLTERGVHVHGVEVRSEEDRKKIMLSVAEDEEESALFRCIF